MQKEKFLLLRLVPLLAVAGLLAAIWVTRPHPPVFEPAATHAVSGLVAEIVTATPDEKTLVYSDSDAQQVGWIDISNPAKPVESAAVKVHGEPTSVAVTPDGKWALCVVREVEQRKSSEPLHHLVVCEVASKRIVRRVVLGGQPDCIEISADGKFAAIAIENERRDPEAPMPQAPAGYLSIFDLKGEPKNWKERRVSMLNLAERFPTDPEPEYIAINEKNEAAVTLQENNAVVIVDLPTGKVLEQWSCGTTTHSADLKKDGQFTPVNELKEARREPDGIAWTPEANLITANEGDYGDDLDKDADQFAGGRNWTIFSRKGEVLFDGNDLEEKAAKFGFYDDERSRKRGVEPENAAVARLGNSTLAFIACEYGSGAAVYDISNEKQPRFVQWLRSGGSPEGILVLPKRGLFVTANEGDGTLSLFRIKGQPVS